MTAPNFCLVVVQVASFLLSSMVWYLNCMTSGMRIMRSLIPASERDVSGFLIDSSFASKVRIISLSSAIVADM